jgi:hypothetical protein
MKPEVHEEIYRVAFDSASSELIEISAAFEKLRARKEQIERLVIVLKPLIGEEDPTPLSTSPEAETQPQVTETSATVSNESNQESASAQLGTITTLSDPFQRRIDHVLGIGAGIRDVRKYSRQF